jgi:hypothetical protein
VKKTVSRKRSTGDLKDTPLKEYTKLLVNEMTKTLNAQTRKKKAHRALKAKKN